MEEIRKSRIYLEKENIRNFLEMDEDWILTCNLEDLKEELIQIGSKSIQVFSLRNKERNRIDDSNIKECIDLKSVNS